LKSNKTGKKQPFWSNIRCLGGTSVILDVAEIKSKYAALQLRKKKFCKSQNAQHFDVFSQVFGLLANPLILFLF
jgi:hypothetical protein